VPSIFFLLIALHQPRFDVKKYISICPLAYLFSQPGEAKKIVVCNPVLLRARRIRSACSNFKSNLVSLINRVWDEHGDLQIVS